MKKTILKKKYPNGGKVEPTYTVPKYTPSENTSTPINKGQQLKQKSNLKKSPQVSIDEYMKILGLAADAAQFTGVGAVPGYVVGLVPTTYDMIKDLKKGDYDQAALDALGYVPTFKLMKYAKYAKSGAKGVNVANKLNNAINVANTANDINQYKNGGNIQPIYTDNPKDKRLKAYNDSLSLYKIGEKNFNKKLDSFRGEKFITPSNKDIQGLKKHLGKILPKEILARIIIDENETDSDIIQFEGANYRCIFAQPPDNEQGLTAVTAVRIQPRNLPSDLPVFP